jgi:hypothetical protein
MKEDRLGTKSNFVPEGNLLTPERADLGIGYPEEDSRRKGAGFRIRKPFFSTEGL